MYITHQKEAFSRAYVAAVSAQAGCASGHWDVDNDSIDVSLIAKDLVGCKHSRAQLDIQIKCTASPDSDDKNLRFPLPIKNYNDLRDEVIVPRLLVVVVIPKDVEDWIDQSEEKLCLHDCAYWLSLSGLPDKENATSVTVEIPKTNLFTSAFLKDCMKNIANELAL